MRKRKGVKVVETKEEIEFIENILKSKRFVWGEYEYTFLKNIISLLQQGEKYREMWEEFVEEYGSYVAGNQTIEYKDDGKPKNVTQWLFHTNKEFTDKIWQKYFPKE